MLDFIIDNKMNKNFEGNNYEIPLALRERFEFLTTKINYAKHENLDELYRGYSIIFDGEFGKYKV